MQAKGVDLYLHRQGIDTTTPAGNAMFQMMGVFAEFERAMIRERVNAGLARARVNGAQLGRPRVDARTEVRIRAELAKGTGILKTAKLCGVGTGTVQRIKGDGQRRLPPPCRPARLPYSMRLAPESASFP